jgi:hypothetical protein
LSGHFFVQREVFPHAFRAGVHVNPC